MGKGAKIHTFDRECVEQVVLIRDLTGELIERKLLVAGPALALLVHHVGAEVEAHLAWASLFVADDVWALGGAFIFVV